MSTLDKAKKRILKCPRDYTYTEAKSLMQKLGFVEKQKGRTSGSRIAFYREVDKRIIMLHKPHPSDVMTSGAVRDLKDFLVGIGEI